MIQVLSRIVLVVVLVGLGLGDSCSVQGEDVSAPDREKLQEIATAIKKNQERFEDFTCRFTYTEGRSASIEDAIAGRVRDPLVREGLWLARNGLMRYELSCPAGTTEVTYPDSPADGKPVFTSVRCSPDLVLYNRDRAMHAVIGPLISVVNLSSRSPAAPIQWTPLSCGVMGTGYENSPAAFVADSIKGIRFCRYVGPDRTHPELEVIETGHHPLGKLEHGTALWYLDRKRSCFPTKVVFKKEKEGVEQVSAEMRVVALRQLENGGYLCEKAVMAVPSGEGISARVLELKSIELRPPAEADLAITINPKTQITVDDERLSYHYLMAPESITAANLPKWVERAQQVGKQRAAEYQRREAGKQ